MKIALPCGVAFIRHDLGPLGNVTVYLDPPDAIALFEAAIVAEAHPPLMPLRHIELRETGRPHHVKATVKILGLVDTEVLEYHWGPDWVVWDAKGTAQQHGQHVEYNLKPEGVDKTRVRFDITVEPGGPIPGFVVRRATKNVLDAAVKGLSDLVAGGGDAGAAE